MNIVIDSPGLWRGPKPASRGEIVWLSRCGVRTIINLQSDTFEDEDLEIEQLRIQSVRRDLCVPLTLHHEPMSVLWPPSRAQLKSVVSLIESSLKNGTVYVHCHDGVDRTGCALWAYDVWVRDRPLYSAYREMVKDGFHMWRYFWWLPFVANSLREG